MDLIEKVKNWLDNQGFSLEMKTASEFRKGGFWVRQSGHYLDTETGKSREIDVIASDWDIASNIQIDFVIECKSSKKPWVLLTSKHTTENYNRLWAFGVLTEKTLKVIAQRSSEFIDRFSWMRKTQVGYNFRQVFGNNQDVAFSAAINVAKACEYQMRPQDQFPAVFGVAFPIIVIDTELFQCSLQENGEILVEEIIMGEFLFVTKIPQYFGSCIRVVTLKHLPQFVSEAKDVAQKFREAFKPEDEKLEASWHEK